MKFTYFAQLDKLVEANYVIQMRHTTNQRHI